MTTISERINANKESAAARCRREGQAIIDLAAAIAYEIGNRALTNPGNTWGAANTAAETREQLVEILAARLPEYRVDEEKARQIVRERVGL